MLEKELIEEFDIDIKNISKLFESKIMVNQSTREYIIYELTRMATKAESIHVSQLELKEEWRDVKDYEGLYMVSNLGRIRNVKELVMKQINAHSGYNLIKLYKKTEFEDYHPLQIHRMVATAFLPNENNLPQVNHKDFNKHNNRVDNLEWCDAKYNSNWNDYIRKGGIPIVAYNKITKEVKKYESQTDATADGFNKNGIRTSLGRVGKSHKEFEWFYLDENKTSISPSKTVKNPKLWDASVVMLWFGSKNVG